MANMVLYDKLFDMVRKEKNHSNLLDLPENFFVEESKSISSEEKLLREMLATNFTEDSQRDLHHLGNKKKLLQELLDLRIRKILMLTPGNAKVHIDRAAATAGMAPGEIKLYDNLMTVMRLYRDGELKGAP